MQAGLRACRCQLMEVILHDERRRRRTGIPFFSLRMAVGLLEFGESEMLAACCVFSDNMIMDTFEKLG